MLAHQTPTSTFSVNIHPSLDLAPLSPQTAMSCNTSCSWQQPLRVARQLSSPPKKPSFGHWMSQTLPPLDWKSAVYQTIVAAVRSLCVASARPTVGPSLPCSVDDPLPMLQHNTHIVTTSAGTPHPTQDLPEIPPISMPTAIPLVSVGPLALGNTVASAARISGRPVCVYNTNSSLNTCSQQSTDTLPHQWVCARYYRRRQLHHHKSKVSQPLSLSPILDQRVDEARVLRRARVGLGVGFPLVPVRSSNGYLNQWCHHPIP